MVLVIDGTGSMSLIIDDVKAKMEQLIQAIHRLVPIARVGIVVFGGKGEKMEVQPLTLSPQKTERIFEHHPGEGWRRMGRRHLRRLRDAMDKMDWKPYAKKVVVLVGDSPPHKEDFAAAARR